MIYKLNNIKENKYKTEIVKNNTVILFKRSMMRGVNTTIGTRIFNPFNTYQTAIVRSYTIKRFKNPDKLKQEDNTPLPLHLKTHAISYNEKYGTVEGVFTSTKKYTKIDDTNYKGESKGQYLAPLKNARKVDPNMLEDIPNVNEYYKKNKDKIEDIIEKSNVRGQEVIKVFKDKFNDE